MNLVFDALKFGATDFDIGLVTSCVNVNDDRRAYERCSSSSFRVKRGFPRSPATQPSQSHARRCRWPDNLAFEPERAEASVVVHTSWPEARAGALVIPRICWSDYKVGLVASDVGVPRSSIAWL